MTLSQKTPYTRNTIEDLSTFDKKTIEFDILDKKDKLEKLKNKQIKDSSPYGQYDMSFMENLSVSLNTSQITPKTQYTD